MNILVKVNPDQFKKLNAAMATYAEGLQKSNREVLQQWGTYLFKQIYERTPPGKGATAKQTGEKAVIRDLKHAVEPVADKKSKFRRFDYGGYFDWTTFENSKSIRKVIRKKDKEVFEKIIANIPSLKKYEVVDFASNLHTSERSKNGTIKKSRNKLTLDWEKWNDYAKKIVSDVGKLKSSWLPALNAFGVKATSWVTRHEDYGYSVTKVSGNIYDKENPSIIVENNSPSIGRMKDFVNFAMKLTHDRLLKDLKAKLAYRQKTFGSTVRT